MRIIAGTYKGKLLRGPTDCSLRPTPNKVKEALFSIIGPRILGARVLDLYAGTGAIGIEALSRGAREVTFVESGKPALHLLHQNLKHCKLESHATIHVQPVVEFLRRLVGDEPGYDVIFADPPYALDPGKELLPSLAIGATIHPHSLVILEHSTKAVLSRHIEPLSLSRQYRYGDTTLSIFICQMEGSMTPCR